MINFVSVITSLWISLYGLIEYILYSWSTIICIGCTKFGNGMNNEMVCNNTQDLVFLHLPISHVTVYTSYSRDFNGTTYKKCISHKL